MFSRSPSARKDGLAVGDSRRSFPPPVASYSMVRPVPQILDPVVTIAANLQREVKRPFVVRSRLLFPPELREASRIRVSWLQNPASFPRPPAAGQDLKRLAGPERMFQAVSVP